MAHDLFDSFQDFKPVAGKTAKFYSLPALEKAGVGKISRLPLSIRIVLESVLRNCDGKKVTEEHVRRLAGWKANAPRTDEIPFVVARIVLQDFTGVPLLADLAAMRGVHGRRADPVRPEDRLAEPDRDAHLFQHPVAGGGGELGDGQPERIGADVHAGAPDGEGTSLWRRHLHHLPPAPARESRRARPSRRRIPRFLL